MKRFKTLFIAMLMILYPVCIAEAISLTDLDYTATKESAELSFTTDQPANVTVKYGKTTSLGMEVNDPSVTDSHTVNLVGLDPDTRYFYRLFFSGPGRRLEVKPYGAFENFKTLDEVNPHKLTGLENVTNTLATVTLKWDESLDGDTKFYAVYRNGVYAGNTTNTQFTDTELTRETSYVYTVTSIDVSGTESPVSDSLTTSTLTPDLTAPKMTEPVLVSVGKTNALIQWSTDEVSNASIMYGVDTLDNVVEKKGFELNHSVDITGLVEGTIYNYVALSCDESGNCVQSNMRSVKAGADIEPPFINVEVPAVHNDYELAISGETEPLATVYLYVNDRISSLKVTEADGVFNLRAVGLLSTEPNRIMFRAVDQVGNENAKEFTLNLDVLEPSITGLDIPAVVHETPYTVTGTVNEEVMMSYTVGTAEFEMPDKVSSVEATVDKNKVSLDWDRIPNIHRYVVYRDNDVIQVLEADEFTDTTVASDRSYAYEVAAMTADGKLGEKSDTITVRMLAGGLTDVPEVIVLNVSEFIVTAAAQIMEIQPGTFNFGLDLKEGENHVVMRFTDLAGNTLELEKDVKVDTVAPVLLEPLDLGYYSPSYSAAVQIAGVVDTPGATVVVSVNNRTSSSGVIASSLSGVIDQLVSEGSYVTTADENGNFKVDIILERKTYPTSATLSREALQDNEEGGTGRAGIGRTPSLEEARRDAFENKILIMAVDESGLVSEPIEGIIEYRICGEGGDWQITVPRDSITPGVVHSEHLLRGIAQFGFNIELEYRGSGDPEKAKLTEEPTVTKFDVSAQQSEDWGSDLLPDSPTTASWSDDYSLGHVLYKLKKWPGDERDMYTKEFMLRNQIKSPVMIELHYSREVAGQIVPAVQKQCMDLTMDIEPRIQERHIPEALLRQSIEVIDDAIETIDMLLEPLDQVNIFLFWSCLGSWVITFFKDIGKNMSCLGVKDTAIEDFKGTYYGVGNSNACSESDNPSRCDGCASQIKSQAELDKYSNWICDRVFCPSAPGISEHAKSNNIYTGSNSMCEEVTVANLWSGGTEASGGTLNVGAKGTKEYACKKEYEDQWGSSCLMMDEFKKAAKPLNARSAFERIADSVSDLCKPQANRDRNLETNIDGKTRAFAVRDGQVYEAEVTRESRPGEGDTVEDRDEYIRPNTDRPLSYGETTDSNGKVTERFVYHDEDGNNKFSEGDTNKIPLGDNQAVERLFTKEKKFVVDPTAGIFRAVQCACVPAVTGYLQLWRNILNEIRKCFQSILVTKNANSGVCKAVLTVYLCDLIFNAIRCVTERYSAGEGGVGGSREVKGFFGAVSDSSNSIKDRVSGRYGKSNLFKTMFNKRKLLHSICLFAFTGDWDLDIAGMMKGEGRIPIDSEVFLHPSTRRFIASDPNDMGKATYIYHLGLGIVAGSDVDWTLELVCTNDNSCNGPCDCMRTKPPGESAFFVDSGRIYAGEFYGGTEDEGDLYIEVKDKVRYNKARITYEYTNNQGEPDKDVVESDISLIGGNPPASCQFDVVMGEFTCGYEIGERGSAVILPDPETEKDIYYMGDTVNLDIQIDKRSPGYDPTNSKTADRQVPKYLCYKVYNIFGDSITQSPGLSTGEQCKILEQDGVYSNTATGEFRRLIPNIEVTEKFFIKSGVSKGSVKLYNVKNEKSMELLRTSQTGTGNVDKDYLIEAEVGEDETMCTVREVAVELAEGSKSVEVKGGEESDPVYKGRCEDRTDKLTFDGIQLRVKERPTKDAQIVLRYSAPDTEIDEEELGQGTARVEVKLRHAKKINEDGDWTVRNIADTPGEVVVIRGETQEYSDSGDKKAIRFKVSADRQKGSGGCALNKNLTKQCKCYPDGTDLGDVDWNCGQDDKNVFCIKLQGTVQCHHKNVCAPSYKDAVEEDCYCDAESGVLCEKGKYCYNKKCDSKEVAEAEAERKQVSSIKVKDVVVLEEDFTLNGKKGKIALFEGEVKQNVKMRIKDAAFVFDRIEGCNIIKGETRCYPEEANYDKKTGVITFKETDAELPEEFVKKYPGTFGEVFVRLYVKNVDTGQVIDPFDSNHLEIVIQ